MESSTTQVDQGELLAQLGWVRALAQRLVADPDVADDVLQRVCLLALDRAPDRARTGPRFRAWLATCTRRLAGNTARGEMRRRRRELAASPVRVASPADEEAARRELLRRVMEAVIELPEPHFSILVDRYYEGRDIAQIARRRGLKQAAVRQRLSRARRELRARLGGDAGSFWTPALAPFAWLWSAVTRFRGLGGEVMAEQAAGSGLAKVLLAAVLIATVGLTGWWSVTKWNGPAHTPQHAELDTTGVLSAVSVEQAESVVPTARPQQVVGTVQPLVATGLVAPEATATAVTGPLTPLTGRTLDAQGRPVEGALVLFGWNRDELWRLHWAEMRKGAAGVEPADLTDAGGRFRVEATPATGGPSSDTGPQLVVLHDAFQTLSHPLDGLATEGFDVGDLVLSPGAQIVGRVVGDAGEPVADAVVHPESSSFSDGQLRGTERVRDDFLDALTREDGTFRMRGLDARFDGLRVAVRDRLGVVVEGLDIRPGATIDVGDIVAGLGASIQGVVVDSDGQPIVHASVQVNREGQSGVNTATDETGAFTITGLAPGSYAVHASAREHAWCRLFGVPTGGTPVRIVMQRYGGLDVRVLDTVTRLPVTTAELSATLPKKERYQPWSNYQYSVRAEVDDLPPGTYRLLGAGPEGTELTITADGYVTTSLDAPGVGEDRIAVVSVELQPERALVGRVVDTEGAAIPGARVVASRQLGRDACQGTAAEDGSFRVGGLYAGEWELSASAAGFGPHQPQAVLVGAGRDADPFTLVLSRSGSIAGTVHDASGATLAGARVMATKRAPAGMSWADRWSLAGSREPGDPYRILHATADAAGRYAFPELPAGRYALWLQRGDNDQGLGVMASLAEEVGFPNCAFASVAAGEPRVVDLVKPNPSTIHGRVTAVGIPIAGAHVVLAHANQDDPRLRAQRIDQARTDALGQYELNVSVPDTYMLIASASTVAVPIAKRIELRAADRRVADFLFRGTDVDVKVVDAATGKPAVGVDVRLYPDLEPEVLGAGAVWGRNFSSAVGNIVQGSGADPFEWEVGSDGALRLGEMPDGEYALSLSGAGFLGAERSLTVSRTVPPGPLTIEMTRGAVIEGVVEAPGLDWPVQLTVGLAITPPRVQRWSQAFDGHFSFDGLEQGTYELIAFSQVDYDTPLGSRRVSVAAGQAVQTTLTLDP